MADRSAASRPERRRRLILWIIGIIGVVIVYFVAAAVIPRWWAQRVADVVDGRLTVGGLYGLFIGFVFTVAPLLVALAVVRWRTERRSWRGWVGWLAVILLAAAPNLMTLGIVLGSGSAAHAGERILDTEGPGFRLWSFVGALAGIAAVLGVWYLARSRRTSRQRQGELRRGDEQRGRDDRQQQG